MTTHDQQLVGWRVGTQAMVEEDITVQYRPTYFGYGPDPLVNQVV